MERNHTTSVPPNAVDALSQYDSDYESHAEHSEDGSWDSDEVDASDVEDEQPTTTWTIPPLEVPNPPPCPYSNIPPLPVPLPPRLQPSSHIHSRKRALSSSDANSVDPDPKRCRTSSTATATVRYAVEEDYDEEMEQHDDASGEERNESPGTSPTSTRSSISIPEDDIDGTPIMSLLETIPPHISRSRDQSTETDFDDDDDDKENRSPQRASPPYESASKEGSLEPDHLPSFATLIRTISSPSFDPQFSRLLRVRQVPLPSPASSQFPLANDPQPYRHTSTSATAYSLSRASSYAHSPLPRTPLLDQDVLGPKSYDGDHMGKDLTYSRTSEMVRENSWSTQ